MNRKNCPIFLVSPNKPYFKHELQLIQKTDQLRSVYGNQLQVYVFFGVRKHVFFRNVPSDFAHQTNAVIKSYSRRCERAILGQNLFIWQEKCDFFLMIVRKWLTLQFFGNLP